MLGLVEPSGCPLSREELTITCRSSAAQTTTGDNNSQTYVAAIISYGNNLQGAAGELQVDLSCQVEISFV